MSTRVRATDIEDRSLPAVCVVTGGRADWNWNVRFVNPAGALVLLLLFGVLPYVVARFLTRHEVVGQLPISEEGMALVREFRRKRLLALLAALAVGVCGLLLGGQVGSWQVGLGAVVVAFLVWLVPAVIWIGPVTGDVEQNGRWVELTGVAPAFTAAVEPRTTRV
jgi:hypothetical protein